MTENLDYFFNVYENAVSKKQQNFAEYNIKSILDFDIKNNSRENAFNVSRYCNLKRLKNDYVSAKQRYFFDTINVIVNKYY